MHENICHVTNHDKNLEKKVKSRVPELAQISVQLLSLNNTSILIVLSLYLSWTFEW